MQYYLCTHTCRHTQTHIDTRHIPADTQQYTMQTYIGTHMQAQTSTHRHTHHTDVYICTNAYTHTHTRTHMYTHISHSLFSFSSFLYPLPGLNCIGNVCFPNLRKQMLSQIPGDLPFLVWKRRVPLTSMVHFSQLLRLFKARSREDKMTKEFVMRN